ncbi:MAG TPA: FKBP-type peptidyl-prolyl cis-trans isomerase, partial [Candidatus Blautia avicola]|nr:FKBP-type peptidyl-prolyl cis-trans isomerase [Candidatus Blautia avicola]
MRKKLAVLLLSMSILSLGAGCSGKEETDTENTQNTAQETEEESVVNSEGLVVAVDVDNLEDYVTLGQYQNLTVEEEPKEEVTQEDVDDYVERQLIYNYAPVEVTQDRAVQENDTVNIDFTGYMDGETFNGGSAQDQDLIIGSGSFIDGFEDGLIGHKKGETVTLDLSFPENYRNNPDLSGKPVTFEVTINSIS